MLQENKWRAARYGLDADIVVDEKGTVRPVRQAILDLVEDLDADGEAARLRARSCADVERILDVGALLPAAARGRGRARRRPPRRRRQPARRDAGRAARRRSGALAGGGAA